mmetsp:Transcript_76794/g.205134  ORF Transcript_76794/g.205134 Transcript_76794/m.205134 type:complete len:388 (-) Transcript_76794:425-1588(-)
MHLFQHRTALEKRRGYLNEMWHLRYADHTQTQSHHPTSGWYHAGQIQALVDTIRSKPLLDLVRCDTAKQVRFLGHNQCPTSGGLRGSIKNHEITKRHRRELASCDSRNFRKNWTTLERQIARHVQCATVWRKLISKIVIIFSASSDWLFGIGFPEGLQQRCFNCLHTPDSSVVCPLRQRRLQCSRCLTALGQTCRSVDPDTSARSWTCHVHVPRSARSQIQDPSVGESGELRFPPCKLVVEIRHYLPLRVLDVHQFHQHVFRFIGDRLYFVATFLKHLLPKSLQHLRPRCLDASGLIIQMHTTRNMRIEFPPRQGPADFHPTVCHHEVCTSRWDILTELQHLIQFLSLLKHTKARPCLWSVDNCSAPLHGTLAVVRLPGVPVLGSHP